MAVKGGGESFYGVWEEYSGFVEVLREAQPYIFMHSGSTFVVLISAEVVASPYLDTILKVALTTLTLLVNIILFCYYNLNT